MDDKTILIMELEKIYDKLLGRGKYGVTDKSPNRCRIYAKTIKTVLELEEEMHSNPGTTDLSKFINKLKKINKKLEF